MEVFFLKDGEEIDPLLARRAENSEKITGLIVKLEAGLESDRERELLAATKEARTPYVESYKRALDLLVNQRKYEEARATIVRETLPRLVEYHRAWNAFAQFEGEQSVERLKSLVRVAVLAQSPDDFRSRAAALS